VSALYIPNSLDFSALSARCAASLAEGACLVIFPEGTRTRRSGPIIVRKGAARISLLSGKPIAPLRLDTNDMWGLGKKDPLLAFNHTDRYAMKLSVLPEIKPENYAALPPQIAVKRMNNDIKRILYNDAERARMA
jgi:1-acyl-sn-glycerol-3-phosphate acyltransferase